MLRLWGVLKLRISEYLFVYTFNHVEIELVLCKDLVIIARVSIENCIKLGSILLSSVQYRGDWRSRSFWADRQIPS